MSARRSIDELDAAIAELRQIVADHEQHLASLIADARRGVRPVAAGAVIVPGVAPALPAGLADRAANYRDLENGLLPIAAVDTELSILDERARAGVLLRLEAACVRQWLECVRGAMELRDQVRNAQRAAREAAAADTASNRLQRAGCANETDLKELRGACNDDTANARILKLLEDAGLDAPYSKAIALARELGAVRIVDAEDRPRGWRPPPEGDPNRTRAVAAITIARALEVGATPTDLGRIVAIAFPGHTISVPERRDDRSAWSSGEMT